MKKKTPITQEKMIQLLPIIQQLNSEHKENVTKTIGQFCVDHDTDVKGAFNAMKLYGVYE